MDSLVDAEQVDGVRPAGEDADDEAAGVTDDACGRVPERPAHRLRLRRRERAGEAGPLEPTDQGVGHAHHGEPGGVRFEAGEAFDPSEFEDNLRNSRLAGFDDEA